MGVGREGEVRGLCMVDSLPPLTGCQMEQLVLIHHRWQRRHKDIPPIIPLSAFCRCAGLDAGKVFIFSQTLGLFSRRLLPRACVPALSVHACAGMPVVCVSACEGASV